MVEAVRPAITTSRAAENGAGGTPRPGRGLAEALVRRPGCTPLGGEGLRLVFRRHRYLLTPLATCAGRAVLLGEWPGHPDVPDCHARRRLHVHASEVRPDAVILCTDAAGTREVWGWRRPAGLLPALYMEEHRSADPEGSRPLPWLEGAEQESVDECSLTLEGGDAAASALLRELRASRALAFRIRRRAGETSTRALVRTIEESRAPEVARRVWGEIVQLRVLDPRCDGGEWLLGCMETLACIALACLERMQGWAAGESLAGPGPSYPDFRRLLRRRRELAAVGGRERFAYETVLLRCLRGVAQDASGAEKTLRRLSSRIPRLSSHDESLLGEALLDVRVGSLIGVQDLRPGLSAGWNRNPLLAGIAAALEEGATALARADVQLVRLRLELGGGIKELAEGREEIRKRRLQLRAAAAAALRESGTVLHPSLEYSEILSDGRFHLVRDSGHGPAASMESASAR